MKLPFGKKKSSASEKSNNEAHVSSRNSKVFGKIGSFFDPVPQKEKVLRREDFNAAGDTYYATVSAGYKISQRILVLLLVIFLLFSLIHNYYIHHYMQV